VNHSDRRFTLDPDGAHRVLWMGLGQVRDLRRGSVRAIIEGRQAQPFTDLRDLLHRVSLQPKEITHLIRCGALDGLDGSRAALLAEAREVEQAGSALQMTFAFARPVVAPESPAQRLAWERHLLGQPVSVHPLEVVDLPEYLPLSQLPEQAGQRVTVAGVRLPGWTGGEGFFLGDGETFVVARGEPAQRAPAAWQPLLVRGRWLGDEWGGFWFQVDGLEEV
jgi:DNA polymerase III alpha subunit